MVDPEGVTALSFWDYPIPVIPLARCSLMQIKQVFSYLRFPSFNFDHPSFNLFFFPQNHKEIELPLESWKCHEFS